MLWRAVKHRPTPQHRDWKEKKTGHSSEYASTVDTVLPLNVTAHNPNDGEPEEAEIELPAAERESTPFAPRGRLPAS